MLPIEKILCPTDFSEASQEAIKAACELTTHFGSELIMLHVVEPVSILTGPEPVLVDIPNEQELLTSSERSLQEVLNQIELKELKTRLIVRRGNAADEIGRTAEIEEVDLVVLATHGQTGFSHFLFGSVTEKVVRLTRCPVLVIHSSAPESHVMEDQGDKGLDSETEADSQTYQEAIESQIKDLGAKLDGLRTKLENIKDQAKGKYQSQVEDLRGKGEDAQKKLGQLKESGGEAWEELKVGLFELRDAFDRAISKFKEKKG